MLPPATSLCINFLTPHDADLHALSLCSKALLVAVSTQARDIRFKRVARDRSAVHVIERCVARFPRLERLELQDSKLNKLPGAVATLNRLKILVAGKIYDPTIATSTCAQLGLMTSLRTVLCFANQPRLTELYLGGNELRELPPNACTYPLLSVLDLSSNKLTTLPPAIGLLVGLKALYLEHNTGHSTDSRHFVLPREIGALTALEILELGSNRVMLDDIPQEIGRLTSLTELNLNNCNVERRNERPGEDLALAGLGFLCELVALRHLDLRGARWPVAAAAALRDCEWQLAGVGAECVVKH